MPIKASLDGLIKYPLSLTEIEGLENDFLMFHRLKQKDKIEYGPKIYNLWRSREEMEEEINKMAQDLPRAIEEMSGNPVEEDFRKTFERASDEVKRNMAAFIIQQKKNIILTPGLYNSGMPAAIKEDDVVDLFRKQLAGWSEGFYVDENGKELKYTQGNAERLINDISVEKIMLPALIYLFEQCDMKVIGLDFLSENSLSTKTKPRVSKKEN